MVKNNKIVALSFMLGCLLFVGCGGSDPAAANGNTETRQEQTEEIKSEPSEKEDVSEKIENDTETSEDSKSEAAEEKKSDTAEEDKSDTAEDMKSDTTGEKKPDTTGEEESETAEINNSETALKEDKREESFRKILSMYKEAQDGAYSMEEVEAMGLRTELVQHGWPYASAGIEVKYMYYDVDSDGEDELIFTYYDDLIDIYGYDGEKARLCFSTPYRGLASIYPDGMLQLNFAPSMSGGYTKWYQFDPKLGDYFAVFEKVSEGGSDSYYTFSYYNISDQERKEVEESYRKTGNYPVWIGEWSDELSKEEYEKLKPDSDPVQLPEGELLSDFTP